MTREDAKDLTLSVLVIVVALLIADNIWLHCKCAAQMERLDAQSEVVAVQTTNLTDLAMKVEGHINPPPQPGFKEKAKETYHKAKAAVKNGYEAVKEKLAGDGNASVDSRSEER